MKERLEPVYVPEASTELHAKLHWTFITKTARERVVCLTNDLLPWKWCRQLETWPQMTS